MSVTTFRGVRFDGDERSLHGDIRLDGREIDLVVGDGLVSFDEELSVTPDTAGPAVPIIRVGIFDPDRTLIRSGLLDLDADDGDRLGREVELIVDGVAYWLRHVGKQQDTFILTFEDRTVAKLRDSSGLMKVSGAIMTDRRFVAHLCERAGVPAPVTADPGPRETAARRRSPAGTLRAERDQAERDDRRRPGIADGADLTVKGAQMTRAQRLVANAILNDALDFSGGDVELTALMYAAIAESAVGATRTVNSEGYGGLLGANAATWASALSDDTAMVRAFMHGGRGFHDGAVNLVKAGVTNPAEIAIKIERPSIWPDNAYAKQAGGHRFLGEARAIVRAFLGGEGIAAGDSRTLVYTRLAPLKVDRGETDWEACTRTADERNARFFVVANEPYYLYDEALMRSRPRMTLSEEDGGVEWIDWEWAPRKRIRRTEVQARATVWQAPPGVVVVLKDDSGPAAGPWFVADYKRDRFSPTANITIIKGRRPIVPTETTQLTVGGEPDGSVRVGRGGTTSPFGGKRAYPVSGAYGTDRGDHVHSGIDVAVPDGTPCVAPFDGTITYAAATGFEGGGMVHLRANADIPGTSIKAGDKIGWGHVKAVYVKVGQRVQAGTKIALSGTAGSGPHVHFVLLRQGGGGKGLDGNSDPTAVLRALGGIA